MKGRVNLGAPSGFEPRTPGLVTSDLGWRNLTNSASPEALFFNLSLNFQLIEFSQIESV